MHEEWKARVTKEAARLGLGVRDYGRLCSLRRLTLATELGSQYAGIAYLGTMELIGNERKSPGTQDEIIG